MNHQEEFLVTFQPGDKKVYVLAGTRLQEAATAADLVLDAPCGGEGTCGKCRVVVSEGAAPPATEERKRLSEEELRAGCRLACQTTVSGSMSVLVPTTSLVNRPYQILVHSEAPAEAEGAPVICKRYVEFPLPNRGDDAPDLARLQRCLGPIQADLSLVRALPRRLREANFQGTAVLDDDRLLDFEPGNTEWDSYGVAIDLGTTTLVAALLDLATGRQVRIASRLNPQTRFGDDVLSRILMARTRSDGLEQLQRAVAEALDEMIGELCDATGIARQQVYNVTLAGNTTMQQLFCGIDPGPLGEVPFVPAVQQGLAFPAAEGGLQIHPRGRVYVLPIIGAFVGGDIVGGILATGIAACTSPTLLIDIGTNGEIVLLADGKLTATSTAAGPAFEGARIAQGMRASYGAIEKVVVDQELHVHVIGHVPPQGLCGSALIDATAELLRHGIVSPQGRLMTPDELPAGVLPDLARRIELGDRQTAFVLADGSSVVGGKKVALTQRDLREVQLASGAIRAGIELLLKRQGLKPRDLDRVLLAGGFGNYIRRGNAQRIGLLPPEIEHQRIRYQGNTSLAGARLVGLSRRCREACDELAARTEHVDLSLEPDFAAAFADAMIFPEP
ncbi:MAG: ASKHA domain-containing protein [Thermoguttaceae bacterium]